MSENQAETAQIEAPRSQLQLDNFLPAIIRNIAEGITTNMARRYVGAFRLTVTEWRIILQLAEHHKLTATQIVDYSAMEKSKVSRAITTLESRGFVVRQLAEGDHRSKNLILTDSGMKIYRAIVPRVLDWEKELIQGLETSEYRDLMYLLDKLASRLKEMD